jgi:hypothetical protein
MRDLDDIKEPIDIGFKPVADVKSDIDGNYTLPINIGFKPAVDAKADVDGKHSQDNDSKTNEWYTVDLNQVTAQSSEDSKAPIVIGFKMTKPGLFERAYQAIKDRLKRKSDSKAPKMKAEKKTKLTRDSKANKPPPKKPMPPKEPKRLAPPHITNMSGEPSLEMKYVEIGINSTVAESVKHGNGGLEWEAAKWLVSIGTRIGSYDEKVGDFANQGAHIAIPMTLAGTGDLNVNHNGNNNLRSIDAPTAIISVDNAGALSRPVLRLSAMLQKHFEIRGHNRELTNTGALYKRKKMVWIFPEVVKFILEGEFENDLRTRMNKGVIGAHDQLEVSKTLLAAISFRFYNDGKQHMPAFQRYTKVENMTFVTNSIVYVFQMLVAQSVLTTQGTPVFRQ